MTIKSSISLSDEQFQFAKRLVEAGRFSSVSAVLQQGVELLRQQLDDNLLEREALAEVLKQRRAGSFISASALDERLEQMIARKRKTHVVRD